MRISRFAVWKRESWPRRRMEKMEVWLSNTAQSGYVDKKQGAISVFYSLMVSHSNGLNTPVSWLPGKLDNKPKLCSDTEPSS